VTPCLVVDVDVMTANIAAMAATAAERGLALRPHAKTHKSPEIARRQLAAGAVGLTVATVAEAEVFVAAGCTDVLIAYPLWVDAARGARLRALREQARIGVGVDSAEGAEAVARHAGRGLEVLVEVDSGHHRTGVEPAAAGGLAVAAARAGLRIAGVFTFPGHGYAPGGSARAALDEAEALAAAAESLARAGVPATVRSGGSTPTAAFTAAGTVTELRPGVYVFGDAQQWELGTADASALALVAAATVVARAPGRVVLDAGSKVLGADRPPWASGFGRVLDHPGARVTALSEHHATVDWPGPAEPPQRGDVVSVVPNHVCAAVNLADTLTAVRNGAVVDVWPVAARGANT
jgi:D-serine deaminase-like pyridoxal phosphate-dependent protein